jgi:hypothetical protein
LKVALELPIEKLIDEDDPPILIIPPNPPIFTGAGEKAFIDVIEGSPLHPFPVQVALKTSIPEIER